MKKTNCNLGIVVVLILIFSDIKVLRGQELDPKVAPPSPNAASILHYGDNNVSLYTGAVSVTIPIHELQVQNLSVPVSLSYTGSHGIKVQEIAPWTGLGWALNAGGVVSRTIRGKADDGTFGFLNIPAIPDAFTTQETVLFTDYATNSKDGEPDKFYYNVNGISGSFFIKKDRTILQIPLSDNLIKPIYINDNPVLEIIAFEVIDTQGTIYHFADIESSRSFTMNGAQPTDLNYYTSSWYLTKINNANNTAEINFEYDNYFTTAYNESAANELVGTSFPHYLTKTETNNKRLKKISAASGYIEFIASASNRLDMKDEKHLAEVNIYASNNALLKSYQLSYSYLTHNGVISINASDPGDAGCQILSYDDGNGYLRLKLDRIAEYDGTGLTSLPPYKFDYNTESYLPCRFSYARDHWGYYNGENNNPSLEPRKKYPKGVVVSTSVFGMYHHMMGNADRNPVELYTKAGVLAKVTYPTGGYTTFEYGLNEAVHDELSNQYSNQAKSILMTDGGTGTVTVDAIAVVDPFVDIYYSTTPTVTLGEFCKIKITITNTETSATTIQYLTNDATANVSYLDSGNYSISYDLMDGTSQCFTEDIMTLEINWKNEIPLTAKKVGGLRINKMIDSDGVSTANDIIKIYDYTYEDNGTILSSGSVVNIPQYGYVETDWDSYNIISWVRTYNTNQPLALTSGNSVGYSHVSVLQESNVDGSLLKSSYSYLSPNNRSDFTRGWNYTKYDDIVTNNGKSYYTRMAPQTDDRDWQRGKLLREKVYKTGGLGEFKLISEVENFYNTIGPVTENNGSIGGYTVLEDGLIKGVSSSLRNGTFLFFKYYELFTGKVELSKTVNTQYDVTDPLAFLKQSTNYYYDTDYQQVSRTITTDSKGRILTTKIKYPYDYAIPGSAISTLVSRNMISPAIEQIQSVNGQVISASGTVYTDVNDLVLPIDVYQYETSAPGENFSESTYGTSFPSYNKKTTIYRYDNIGNILEFSREDNTHTSYIWGYNNTYPVAKIENATFSAIEAILGTDFSANSALTSVQEDALRNAALLANAIITTYTYKLGVGIETVTDANGKTTTYHYDEFTRLKFIEDFEGNMLKAYEYHYK